MQAALRELVAGSQCRKPVPICTAMEYSEISRIKRVLRQVRGKIVSFNSNCTALRKNSNNNVDENNYNRALIQPFTFYIVELWSRLLRDGLEGVGQSDVQSLGVLATFSYVQEFPCIEDDQDLELEEECYKNIPREYRR